VEGLDAKPELIHVAKSERRVIERDKSPRNTTVYESLAFKRPNRLMDPFLLTIPAGVCRDEALAHEGEEFLLVEKGCVRFEFDGHMHELNEGDAIYFDSSVPHRLMNMSDQEVSVLCVFCKFRNT
jgi:mannose-6-phosphate isomerase-like protein (cupin superfamily)